MKNSFVEKQRRIPAIQHISKIALCLFLVSIIITGCSDNEPSKSTSNRTGPASETASKSAEKQENASPPSPPAEPRPPEQIVLPGDDQILARVDGTPVTRYELDQLARSTFPNTDIEKLDRDVRRKLLESLVLGRAIARASEAELSARDLAEVEKMARAYREEILVKKYLVAHADPEPVTREMIREFYESHPEKFGAKKIRTFEMVFTPEKPNARQREGLLEFLKAPEQEKDWKAWADSLKQRGHPVAYRKGEIDEKLLQEKIRNLIRPLKKDETTPLTFIDGKAYVARIVDEKDIEPKPLRLAGDSIRKILAPVQLQKAIEKTGEKVLGNAEVVYER